MKLYALVAISLPVVFIGLFTLVETLEVPLLLDPTPWLSRVG